MAATPDSGGHWLGVVGGTPSMPLGIEAPVYEDGRVIPYRDYSRVFPGLDALMSARPPRLPLTLASEIVVRPTEENTATGIPRQVYVETERLATTIAARIAAGLSEIVINGSVESLGRGAENETYQFKAQVSIGQETFGYVHPGGTMAIPHGDKEGEADLREYTQGCLRTLRDAIERQGKGRLNVTEETDGLKIRGK